MVPDRTRSAEQGDWRDLVVEAYKPGIDVTLLDRNLTLTPTQRLEQLQEFVRFLDQIRRAGATADRPLR
jgi:hypothetical protein